MNILALDTSTSACSVALLENGSLTERHEILQNRHSDYLLKFIDELLSKARLKVSHLDAVAVGSGPGSFTGIRLGMGVAQGLAYGANKPLIPISSLQAIALISSSDHVLVAVDARMGEVYWQCFHRAVNQELVALSHAKLDRPHNIMLDKADLDWQGVGSGFDQYGDQLSKLLGRPDNWIQNVLPQARSILRLAQADIEINGMPDSNAVVPTYIRNKVTG